MPVFLSPIPAILFLLISFFFGVQLLRYLFPDAQRIFIGVAPKRETLALIPTILFYYPAGLMIGLTLVTFVTYFTAYVMAPFMPKEMAVLYPANVVSLGISIYLASFFWQKRYSKRVVPIQTENTETVPVRRRLGGHRNAEASTPTGTPKPEFKPTTGTIVFLVLSVVVLTAAMAFLFYYSYRVVGRTLIAGYSVFSDLSPHTALVSSFAKGLNFPTMYPHFPDGSIRYHFMFYFLCGNLNALGLPIDHAFNISSILAAVSCFVLLGTLSVLLFGRKIAFLLAPVLVLFRSSLAFFHQVAALATAPGATVSSILSGVFSNTEFIGTTPYDNWGLWANNVYANQRHLLFGTALILIVLFFFLPHVRRMFLHVKKASGFRAKITQFLFCREAWIPRKKDPIRPSHLIVISAILVFCMPYFHGSALIALLLILFFLAIFSENRLSYLLVATIAVLSSFAQTYFFSGGAENVVSFSYYWGFVVTDPTAPEVANYLLQLTGVAIIVLLLSLFIQKSAYRAIVLAACVLPCIFTFLVAMTIDVTSNHKFIQISLILFSAFIGGTIAFLFSPFEKRILRAEAAPSDSKIKRVTPGPAIESSASEAPSSGESRKTTPSVPIRGMNKGLRILTLIGSRLLAVILLILLTVSGISDTIVFVNKNVNYIEARLDSAVVAWITEKTPSRAVFLTAPFSMHSFFLSGRYSYFGHPYYAWSAGYDTDKRSKTYGDLLSGCGGDKQAFLALCRQEGISYIMVDNEMRSNKDYPMNIDFFTSQFEAEASFPEENDTVIYRVS